MNVKLFLRPIVALLSILLLGAGQQNDATPQSTPTHPAVGSSPARKIFTAPDFGRYDSHIIVRSADNGSAVETHTVIEFVDRNTNISALYINENGKTRCYMRDRATSYVTSFLVDLIDAQTHLMTKCNPRDREPEFVDRIKKLLRYNRFVSEKEFIVAKSWYGPSLMLEFVAKISDQLVYVTQSHLADSINQLSVFSTSSSTLDPALDFAVYVERADINDSIEPGVTTLAELAARSKKFGVANIRAICNHRLQASSDKFMYCINFLGVQALNWIDFDDQLGTSSATGSVGVLTPYSSPLMMPAGIKCRSTLRRYVPNFALRGLEEVSAQFFTQTYQNELFYLAADLKLGLLRFDSSSEKRIYNDNAKQLYSIRKEPLFRNVYNNDDDNEPAGSNAPANDNDNDNDNDNSSKQLEELDDGPVCSSVEYDNLESSALHDFFLRDPYKITIASFIGLQMIDGQLTNVYEKELTKSADGKFFLAPKVFVRLQNMIISHNNNSASVLYYTSVRTEALLRMELIVSSQDGEKLLMTTADTVEFVKFSYDVHSVAPPHDWQLDELSRDFGPAQLFSLADCSDSSADELLVDFDIQVSDFRHRDKHPSRQSERRPADTSLVAQVRARMRDISASFFNLVSAKFDSSRVAPVSWQLRRPHDAVEWKQANASSLRLAARMKLVELDAEETEVAFVGYSDFLSFQRAKARANRKIRVLLPSVAGNRFDCAVSMSSHFAKQLRHSRLVAYVETGDCWLIEETERMPGDGFGDLQIYDKWTDEMDAAHFVKVELVKIVHSPPSSEANEFVDVAQQTCQSMRELREELQFSRTGRGLPAWADAVSSGEFDVFATGVAVADVVRVRGFGNSLAARAHWRLSADKSSQPSDDEPTRTVTFNWLNFVVPVPSDQRVNVGEFCKRACALEETCNSYSYCTSAASSDDVRAAGCILSNLVYNRTTLRVLSEASVEQMDKASVVHFSDASSKTTHLVTLHKAQNCFIVGKDLHQLYKHRHTYRSHFPANLEPLPAQMSLDECASVCHQHELDVQSLAQPINGPRRGVAPCVSFVHCNNEQRCFVEPSDAIVNQLAVDPEFANVDTDEPATASTGDNSSRPGARAHVGAGCMQFNREFDLIYNAVPSTHLAGISLAFQVEPASELAPHADAIDTKTMAALAEAVEVKPNISAVECALDCSVSATNCLAFDFAQLADVTLCLLFKIRSPRAQSNNTRYPLLDVEKIFYDKAASEQYSRFGLRESSRSTHYYLSGDLLEQKLDFIRRNFSMDAQKELAMLDGQQTRISQAIVDMIERFKQRAHSASSSTGWAKFALFALGATVASLVYVFVDWTRALAAIRSFNYKSYQNRNRF